MDQRIRYSVHIQSELLDEKREWEAMADNFPEFKNKEAYKILNKDK